MRGHRAGVAALGRRDGGRRCWSSTVIRSGSSASTSNGNSMAHCARPAPPTRRHFRPALDAPPLGVFLLPGARAQHSPARHPFGSGCLHASSFRPVPSPSPSPRDRLGAATAEHCLRHRAHGARQGRMGQLPTPGGLWSRQSLVGLAAAWPLLSPQQHPFPPRPTPETGYTALLWKSRAGRTQDGVRVSHIHLSCPPSDSDVFIPFNNNHFLSLTLDLPLATLQTQLLRVNPIM